jgi:hypothetical protein
MRVAQIFPKTIVITDAYGADKFQDLDAYLYRFNRPVQARFPIFPMRLSHFVSVNVSAGTKSTTWRGSVLLVCIKWRIAVCDRKCKAG